MNKVVLIGNLTRDPELRTTPSGTSVCTFTVACQRRSANAQGVREADFIPVVAWQQQAEFVARYFTKGRKIAVHGRIQVRSYDAQDGSKRYVTEVVADEVEFVDRPADGGNRPLRDNIPLPPEPPMMGGNPSGAAASTSGFAEEVDDDELPF